MQRRLWPQHSSWHCARAATAPTCGRPSTWGRYPGTTGRCLAGTARPGWRPQQCAAARRRLRGAGRVSTRARQGPLQAPSPSSGRALQGSLPPPPRTRVRHTSDVVRDVDAAHDERVARLQAVQVPAVAHAEGKHGRLGRRSRRRCRCRRPSGPRAAGLPRRPAAAGDAAAAAGAGGGLRRERGERGAGQAAAGRAPASRALSPPASDMQGLTLGGRAAGAKALHWAAHRLIFGWGRGAMGRRV